MKHLPVLTPRLQKIADMLIPCDCVADIGTDHGYLPVFLCGAGICKTAIASDVNEGPLHRAEATVFQYKMDPVISLRLGSGAEPLAPGEADAIVIAGMGGLLIGELLKASSHVFAKAKQILLQPMSSIPELREELYQMGYTIIEEALVPEDKKLYHILSVLPKPEAEDFSKLDFLLGKNLIQNQPQHFDQYIQKELIRQSRKVAGLKQAKEINETALQEAEILLEEIQQIAGGMEDAEG